MSLKPIMITSAIEAHEVRGMAAIDIPGAYLYTDLYEEVVTILKVRLAELLANINPKLCRKYVVLEKGVMVSYVKLQKALYGLLHSALLFYLKLATYLKNNGFIINPYDPCVANKLFKGETMSVVWNFDYLKLSHKDSFEVTNFFHYLLMICGEKLKLHRGKVHDYLGMDLYYSETRVLTVLMIKYLEKVLNEFPEELRGTSATLVAYHIFQLRWEDEAGF